MFFFYRQRISVQRSEPNKTVSEFHLSAVKGILLPHPMLSSPEIIPSISPLPDTTDKNVSCRQLWIKIIFFLIRGLQVSIGGGEGVWRCCKIIILCIFLLEIRVGGEGGQGTTGSTIPEQAMHPLKPFVCINIIFSHSRSLFETYT